jgi:hypothetical protein
VQESEVGNAGPITDHRLAIDGASQAGAAAAFAISEHDPQAFLWAFDLLELDGEDFRPIPAYERRLRCVGSCGARKPLSTSSTILRRKSPACGRGQVSEVPRGTCEGISHRELAMVAQMPHLITRFRNQVMDAIRRRS